MLRVLVFLVSLGVGALRGSCADEPTSYSKIWRYDSS